MDGCNVDSEGSAGISVSAGGNLDVWDSGDCRADTIKESTKAKSAELVGTVS